MNQYARLVRAISLLLSDPSLEAQTLLGILMDTGPTGEALDHTLDLSETYLSQREVAQ
jgi:hypothetical protein